MKKNWVLFLRFHPKGETMSEQFQNVFQQYDIKFTTARASILEVLKVANSPLSYEQIKEHMSVKMDKATFYRNIAKFEELGMVHKFESDDRKWYFELSSTTHAHFICEQCHKITCMEVDLGNVEGEVTSIVLKGICKACHA